MAELAIINIYLLKNRACLLSHDCLELSKYCVHQLSIYNVTEQSSVIFTRVAMSGNGRDHWENGSWSQERDR